MVDLRLGDCAVVLGDLSGDLVDLTVTSPPYDNLREYNGYTFDFDTIAKELFRVTKPGGVLVWVVSDAMIDGSESGTSFKQALGFKEMGFSLHDTMIWKKQTSTDTGSLRVRYGNIFEYMFVLSKGKPKTFNPIKDRINKSFGRKKSGTIRQPNGTPSAISSKGKPIAKMGQRHNIWEICTEVSNNKRVHPAQFPESLARDHIISWSNPGDVVLDPFLGSGTTGKVAVELNRQFIGIEISQEYLNLATGRINMKGA